MTTAEALDIEEQNAVCAGCDKPIKRYGSDGFWFTDRYDCANGGLHAPSTTCGRCKREVRPWPLGHRSCSPNGWVYCITTDVAER